VLRRRLHPAASRRKAPPRASQPKRRAELGTGAAAQHGGVGSSDTSDLRENPAKLRGIPWFSDAKVA
jgi:hypothetical protein